jgi:hypothetical protein
VRNASLDAHVFPVPLVETAALAAITATGAAALPFAPPGTAVAWVLLSYGIVRFGLEWLRGDKRPEWMGLSQAQWMSATQAVAVIGVWGRAGLPDYAILAPAVAAALAYVRLGLGGRLRSRRHLLEVRAAVRSAMERPHPGLFLHTTTQGLSIAVSASATDDWHVSISRPGVGLRTLCAVAAAAVPEPVMVRTVCVVW